MTRAFCDKIGRRPVRIFDFRHESFPKHSNVCQVFGPTSGELVLNEFALADDVDLQVSEQGFDTVGPRLAKDDSIDAR